MQKKESKINVNELRLNFKNVMKHLFRLITLLKNYCKLNLIASENILEKYVEICKSMNIQYDKNELQEFINELEFSKMIHKENNYLKILVNLYSHFYTKNDQNKANNELEGERFVTSKSDFYVLMIFLGISLLILITYFLLTYLARIHNNFNF